MSGSAEQLLARASRAVSSRLGIGRALAPLVMAPGHPELHLFAAEPAHGTAFGGRASRRSSGGSGVTASAARLAALGELFEGYCASFVPRQRLWIGSYDELTRTHAAVSPDRWALFSSEQYGAPGFPFAPFDQSTIVAWTGGYSLTHRREVWVPAAMVYMPYSREPREADIGPTISTGLGAGRCPTSAVLAGLYEVIERDAFTIFWLNRSPVRRLRLDGDSPTARVYRERLARPGHCFRAFLLESDLRTPVAYVLLEARSERGTVYAVGAASRSDHHAAVHKALLEAAQGESYVRHLLARDPAWRPLPDFSNVVDFEASAKLYSVAPELAPELLSVEQRVVEELSLAELPHEPLDDATALRRLVQRLTERGHEVIVVDLTTADVAQLGFRVVRVLVPGLQPLHGQHRWPFLGGRRLYDVPRRLGHRPEPSAARELSPFPHPFP